MKSKIISFAQLCELKAKLPENAHLISYQNSGEWDIVLTYWPSREALLKSIDKFDEHNGLLKSNKRPKPLIN